MDWANMSAEDVAKEIKKLPDYGFIPDKEKSYQKLVGLIEWRRAMKFKTGKPKLTKSFGAKHRTHRTKDGVFVTFPSEFTDGNYSKGYSETIVWKPGWSPFISELGHNLSEEQVAILMAATPNAAEQDRIKNQWEEECTNSCEAVAAGLQSSGKNQGHKEKMRSQAVDKAYNYLQYAEKIWKMSDEDILTLIRMLERGGEVDSLSKYVNANRYNDTGWWDLEFVKELRNRINVKKVMTE